MRILPLLLISALSVASPALAEGIKIIGKGSIKPTPAKEAPAEAPAEAPTEAPAEGTDVAAAPEAPAAIAPAPVGMVTAEDPASIVAALQDYGVAAKLEADDEGDPIIRVKIAGANSTVYFYGCDDNGQGCRSISFSAGFELDNPYTVEQANEWNFNNRFSKSYVTEDGAAQIEMDVNLVGGGTSTEGFADTIDWWDYSVSEYKTFIGW